MAAVKKPSPGYHIDGRVSIALDALDDDQKRSVDGVLKDRDRFVANAADKHRVRKISEKSPLYALSIPSGLRIIFSQVGDDIVVLDLMRQVTLDRYGRRKTVGATGSGSLKARARSAAPVKKAK